jgi:hypothetical protein
VRAQWARRPEAGVYDRREEPDLLPLRFRITTQQQMKRCRVWPR